MSKISLGIGEKKTVNLSGGRFYYEKGVGRIGVKSIGDDSSYFELSPGMGFQNLGYMKNFQALEIENLSPVKLEVDFIVSYREVFDNRVTFGDSSQSLRVDIAPRTGVDAVVGGMAFLHSRYAGPQGAGLYANIALRNPAGSGRNVFVKSVDAGSTAALDLLLMKTVNIATVQAGAAVSLLSAGFAGPGSNKFVRLSPGLPVCAVDSFASTGGAISGLDILMRVNKPINATHTFKFSEPIVLTPGAGLVVSSWDVNTPLTANFETVEELI